MTTRRTLLRGLGASVLAAVPAVGITPALAQGAFPEKVINLVVPFPPGGITDQLARDIAKKMQEALGKPVVVENKPGAGGQIGANTLKTNPADGHTMFFAATEMFAINPTLYKKFSYSPTQDFAPVTSLASSPLVLVVPAASPFKSVDDIIKAAKAKDGSVSYASQGVGSIGHLLGEMFRGKVGGSFNHIAYKGSSPALQDLMGGQVDMMFDPIISTSPLVNSGRLRALAIAAPKRSAAMPDVKTLAELGIADVDASVWFGAVVKAGTPEPIVKRLNEVVVAALNSPDLSKRFGDQGLEMAPRSPAEFGTFLTAEIARWSALVKSTGASVD